MRIKLLLVSLVIGAVCAAPLAAKGPTRKLVVSGPALADPITLTTSDALANVWSGDFIGAASDQPNVNLPRYLVEFYVEPPRGHVQMMYSVTFACDPVGHGYVYLPGRGEPGWRRNVGTIMRDDQDGRWHHAADAWSRAIARGLRLVEL